MTTLKQISSALISVYSKEGLDRIVKKLDELSITLYSTGGTFSFIEGLGIPVTAVEQLTSYPSILGGRVKTLHPKIFGGILGRRDNQGDLDQLAEYEIPQIDLVIVDLYPFEDTVLSGAADQDIIEKIDIGGISLIRAAAKNHKDVLVVASMDQYEPLLALLESGSGTTSLDDDQVQVAADALGMHDAVWEHLDVHELILGVVEELRQRHAVLLAEDVIGLACLARHPVADDGVHRVVGAAAIHPDPAQFLGLGPIGELAVRAGVHHHVADFVGGGHIPAEVVVAGVDDQDVALAHFDALLDHLAGVNIVIAANVAQVDDGSIMHQEVHVQRGDVLPGV